MLHSKSDSSGFTIVELVITLVAFGFIAAGLAGIFLSIQTIQKRASDLDNATRAAQTEIESLRNNNYNQLTSGQTITFTDDLPSNLPLPHSGTVVVSEPTPGVKRVDVTVAYNEHGDTRKVKLSSLIGVIGISQ